MTRLTRLTPVSITLLAVLLSGCAASRAPEAELQQLAAAMRLQPGMRIADVGAGDGEWTEALAERIGDEGHVFSTEIDEDDVEDLRERFEDAGLTNVTVLLGRDDHTGLPDGCCDAVLLRLVYHHFTDPPAMIGDVHRALRPGGRLVVIEITPQSGWGRLDGVPERDGHGVSPEDLLAEVDALQQGWMVEQRQDDWGDEDDHYCVVFLRD